MTPKETKKEPREAASDPPQHDLNRRLLFSSLSARRDDFHLVLLKMGSNETLLFSTQMQQLWDTETEKWEQVGLSHNNWPNFHSSEKKKTDTFLSPDVNRHDRFMKNWHSEEHRTVTEARNSHFPKNTPVGWDNFMLLTQMNQYLLLQSLFLFLLQRSALFWHSYRCRASLINRPERLKIICWKN